MILRKPLALVLMKAVIKKVTRATRICLMSPPSTKPAFLTAELAKPKPITIIMGPITIGGNKRSIQVVPIARIKRAIPT